MKSNNPFDKARGYLKDAQSILINYGELDTEIFIYSDRKYVKKAGKMLWHGVLLVLDSVFHMREDRRKHVDAQVYKNEISKHDETLSKLVVMGYESIYCIMGFDGNPCKEICDSCFQLANRIIDRCEDIAN